LVTFNPNVAAVGVADIIPYFAGSVEPEG